MSSQPTVLEQKKVAALIARSAIQSLRNIQDEYAKDPGTLKDNMRDVWKTFMNDYRAPLDQSELRGGDGMPSDSGRLFCLRRRLDQNDQLHD